MPRNLMSPESKQRMREGQRVWREKNPTYMKNWRAKNKKEAIAAYGGACTCCGERLEELLSIDHVYNDGAEHRRQSGVGTGAPFYHWLKKQGFPKDRFQLLCFNCNCAKAFFGICPHQTALSSVVFIAG